MVHTVHYLCCSYGQYLESTVDVGRFQDIVRYFTIIIIIIVSYCTHLKINIDAFKTRPRLHLYTSIG